MLKLILGIAFARVSFGYNLPNYKPTIQNFSTTPVPLFEDKHVQAKGSGVLQLEITKREVQSQKLNSRDLQERQNLDPLTNVINGYTIDSTYSLLACVYAKHFLISKS